MYIVFSTVASGELELENKLLPKSKKTTNHGMVYGCIVMYMATMLGPPVISWFISPSNYSYKYIP